MNKTELIKAISEQTGSTQAEVARQLDAMLHIIRETVADGDVVNLPGLGVFKARARKSRLGYNPRTGERVEIPARRVPTFTPGKSFREVVSK